jgi:hypothetical protein
MPTPGYTRNIMLTGYWPPTNDMVRRFSTSSDQNPKGWIGKNWQNTSYDIYSFFPEFPEWTEESGFPSSSARRGVGDLQVDYQATSSDFWRLATQLRPCAIVTTSWNNVPQTWKLEERETNHDNWVTRNVAPSPPMPSPPDPSIPAGATRDSTLPISAIFDAVRVLDDVDLLIHTGPAGSGNFLSGFVAYLGIWYQALNASGHSPNRCVAAGHIHVGDPSHEVSYQDHVKQLEKALNATLKAVIEHVNRILPS